MCQRNHVGSCFYKKQISVKTFFSRLTIHQGLRSKSVQQQQSWLIKGNEIKVITIRSEMMHMFKTLLGVITN